MNQEHPSKQFTVSPMTILISVLILISVIPSASAYINESIDMITFPAGELEYKGFIYSADMCNALDCYRAWETAL